MRFTLGDESQEIDFPVWDVVTNLPRNEQLGSAAGVVGAIVGVSLVRGNPPLERGDEMSPGFVVWSFDPSAASRDLSWPARMAVLEFVQALETHAGETVQSGMSRVMASIAGAGSVAVLNVEDQQVSGEVHVFDGVGVLAVSKGPGKTFAAACFGVSEVPSFRRLEEGDLSPE